MEHINEIVLYVFCDGSIFIAILGRNIGPFVLPSSIFNLTRG